MIKIPIKHLKPALLGLAKLGLTKATLPELRCVRVDATPAGVSLTCTDLTLTARVQIPDAETNEAAPFLVPFERLQSLSRRLPGDTRLGLEPGKISFDLSSNHVVEEFEAPASNDFPEDLQVTPKPSPLPESFGERFHEAMQCSSHDTTRQILNGVAFDLSGSGDSGHYIVATDGRQLFNANSFHFPISQPVIVPNHKLLLWPGLTGSWAIAVEARADFTLVRLVVGNWTLTCRVIDGNYPNWRQVLVRDDQVNTRLTFPEEHSFGKIIQALPGGDQKDKPVDVVVSGNSVAVMDSIGGSPIPLIGVTAKGPDVSVRLNRDYLTRALGFGLNQVGIVDAMSPLRFTREGRTFVVMPLRMAAPPNPAPSEPQPERKETMPETNGARPRAEVPREASTRPSAENPAEKPALEAAIDKLDAFKSQFKETLASLNELTALLRQAVREQKAGEKEIQTVRQTLRSLQSVRI
jgi:DNA polymerase III sliding clamp (beta) subunit (PCNA family)